jgi:hypothetical protein
VLANNRFFGVTAATVVSGLAPTPSVLPRHQALARRSGGFGRTAAVPRGYGAIGAAWPTLAGEIAADPDAALTLTALPALVLAARQVVGDATIELTAAGDVQATAVVEGTAAIELTSAADIQAAAAVVGQTTMTFGAVGDVGALAPVAGSALLTLSASTTVAMGATARTEGVAYFSAAAEGSQLTDASIASAVWGRAIEAGFSAEQILRILASHAAGAATGLESGNPQFLGLDGDTVRIDGAYAAGTRTIDALNGD